MKKKVQQQPAKVQKTQLQVFDPPMCCSSGVCGAVVDPKLARFSADLEWVKQGGVDVERYNLAQQPAAFAGKAVVKGALKKFGNDALPLILLDGRIVSRGAYPTRETLAGYLGLALRPAKPVAGEAVSKKQGG